MGRILILPIVGTLTLEGEMFKPLFLFSICFSLILSGDHPVYEKPVNEPQVEAKFFHHSHVKHASNNAFELDHFIRNDHPERPLSVKWDEAAIYCDGTRSLKPGQKARGNSGKLIYNPFAKDSKIKYGARLDYKAEAKVYTDPNLDKDQPNALTRTSAFEIEDKDGKVTVAVHVTSILNEKRDSSTVTFRVLGGLSLALPADPGAQITKAERQPAGDRWVIAQPVQFERLGFKDNIITSAMEWLRVGTPNKRDVIVLDNRSSDQNEVSFTMQGANWKLEEVRILGFTRGENGTIGMAAAVYLPNRAR
jgi:hypothetical protein